MLALLYRFSTGRNVVLWLLPVLAFMFGVMPYLGKQLQAAAGPEGTQQALDLSIPTYSIEEAHAAIRGYGEAGRALYARIQTTADVVYPILYAVAFALSLAFLRKKAAPRAAWAYRLPLLPLIGACFDLLENTFIVVLLRQYPQQSDAMARLAQMATFGKWFFVISSVFLVFAGLAGWLLRRR